MGDTLTRKRCCGFLKGNQASASVNDMNVMNASPRRKELTRLAAQLFVQEGFDRTTVRMLAQEMGIKSGSLFHHFKDKQEILAAVIEEGTQNALIIARKALDECAADPEIRLRTMARAHLETLFTDRNAHVVALLSGVVLTQRRVPILAIYAMPTRRSGLPSLMMRLRQASSVVIDFLYPALCLAH